VLKSHVISLSFGKQKGKTGCAMSFLPRLVCSQSAPNLFFDWTDLERKLVFEQEKIEEGNKIEKKKTGYLQNIDFNFSVSSAKIYSVEF
jgi:hypothetical protein